MARANQEASPKPREHARPAERKHAVPPPPDELEVEPPETEPALNTVELELGPEDELLTHYPDRSEWEADVSERAREEIRRGQAAQASLTLFNEVQRASASSRPPAQSRRALAMR